MEPEGYHHVYKIPPLVPVMSHFNSLYSLPLHFHKMYFTIIVLSTPWSSTRPFSAIFPHQIPVSIPLPPHVPRTKFSLITRIMSGLGNKLRSSSLYSALQSAVTWSLMRSNIFLSFLFLSTFSLQHSVNVSGQRIQQ